MSIYGKMKRLGVVLVMGLTFGFGLGAAGFGMALAGPGFTHQREDGQVRLRMDKPLPEAARAFLALPDRPRMQRWFGALAVALRDGIALDAYPRERLLADWALHHRGREFLLRTDLTEDWALMTADGWGGQE
jgi:hypothetical protein